MADLQERFNPAWAASPAVLGTLEAEGGPYLPIEAFRGERLPWKGQEAPARIFQSSGTTAETRSRSPFSSLGLAAYRERALAHFRAVIEDQAGVPLENFRGLSLIPPVGEWPDSSLAQMVAWIAEIVPVQYVRIGELEAAIASGHSDRPVWVFGTAFHFVQALDVQDAPKLPAGSLLIETGGTKGKTRSVTREDLYRELEAAFGVRQRQIVSEYGMCELACQAYDWVPHSASDDYERRFRFSSEVEVRVVTGPGRIEKVGTGALLVHDPKRLDVALPIRTEDLVKLDHEGFHLLGRIPKAPLKGCSLKVEDIAQEAPSKTPVLGFTEGTGRLDPAKLLWDLKQFFVGKEAETCLSVDLGSRQAARLALNSLLASLPQDESQLLAAAKVATTRSSDKAKAPSRWLFVLPSNHPIVGIYPVALGAVAGLEMTVRVPKALAGGFFDAFLDLIGDRPGVRLARVSDELRLPVIDPQWDAILAYGEDDTVARLKATQSQPVVGFGHGIGASLILGQIGEKEARRLVEDAFGLGQRGCMSVRYALLLECDDAREVYETIKAASEGFWGKSFTLAENLGLEAAEWRLRQLGFNANAKSDEPLIAMKRCKASQLASPVIDRPFVLPLVDVLSHDRDELVKTVTRLLTFTRATTVTFGGERAPSWSQDLARICQGGLGLRRFGLANVPAWDGRHQGRPLFVP